MAASAPSTDRPTTTALLWYRPFDLRTDDHAALADAATSADRLLPIYCFDEARELCPPRSKAAAAPPLPPTGPHRLRFRLEALSDLRQSLAALGSGLVVRPGAPEEVLPRVLEEIVEEDSRTAAVSLVFHRRPPAPPLPGDEDEDEDEDEAAEERRVAEALARACERLGLAPPSVRRHWGAATLHHPLTEVAAWLGSGGGAPTPPPPPPPSASSSIVDADGSDGAETVLLPHLLPDTFSAYRRALEAGAIGRRPTTTTTTSKTTTTTQKKKKKKHQPPLRAWLPSSPPLAAPHGPLPALPPPFSSSSKNNHGALPRDTHALYESAGPEALGALRELSRLCGDADLSGPGAVVPAYACAGGGGEELDDGVRHPRADPRSAFPYVGGERAARVRLDFVLRRVLLSGPSSPPRSSSFGEARMMAAGAESAKLSPYLSAGCLSPRRVAAELGLKRDADDDDEDEDARWLLSHLVIRDWYVLSGWRERSRRRRGRGGGGEGREAAPPPPAFEAWARGASGASPFVDATMRELAATGWQSNRSRQVAASVLAHDLLLPPPKAPRGEGEDEGDDGGEWGGWTLGARLYECLLIDGDRSANRGNWRSVCARRFDPEAQQAQYDPDKRLERAWL
jgi:deoxyribodipyrimidine photolyase